MACSGTLTKHIMWGFNVQPGAGVTEACVVRGAPRSLRIKGLRGVVQEVSFTSRMERCSESPVTHLREESEKHQQKEHSGNNLVTEVMQNSLEVKIEKEYQKGPQR